MGSTQRKGALFTPVGRRVYDLDRRQGLTWCLGVTGVGLLLRLLTLNSRSFWLDETTSVRQTAWSIPMIIDRMSGNVHPPLFHFMLHYWIRAFGRTELAVRSFALLFGVLAIPAVYWAATVIYNRRVGVFAAAVVALSPYFIWYSQEARMYSMLMLFAALSVGSLYRAIDTHRFRWWAVYALSTAAGMFTHYFFAFIVLMQGIFMLLHFVIGRERDLGRTGKRRVRWTRPWLVFADCREASYWLLSLIVVLLPQAWWVPKVLHHSEISGGIYQSLSYGNPSIPGWHFNEIILATSQALFGVHSEPATKILSAMWPLAITVAFLVSGHLRRVSVRTWYVIYTGIVSAGLIAILGQWQPVYEVRYFTAAAIPISILVGRFLAELRPPVAKTVCALLVVLAAVMYVDQGYNPDSVLKWDNRQAAAVVYKGYEPGDAILLVPYYASSVLEYYLPAEMYHATRFVPQIGPDGKPRNSVAQIGQDVSQDVGPAKRVWLVSSFTEAPRIESDRVNVTRWLESHGYHQTRDFPLHRIRVTLWEGTPNTQFFVTQGGGQ